MSKRKGHAGRRAASGKAPEVKGGAEAPSATPSAEAAPAAPPEPLTQQQELDQAIAAGEANRPAPPVPPPAAEPDPATEALHKASDFVETMDQGAAAATADRAQLLAELTQEDVEDFLKLGFSLTAFRRGDHWTLSDEEAAHISKWVRKSIERHGVEWVAKWLPDVMAGALLGYAIVRRLEIDKKLKADRKQATEKKGGHDATPGAGNR